jgi:hypothetical protein
MLPPVLWCAMRLATSRVDSVLALPALLAVVMLWPVAMQAISKVGGRAGEKRTGQHLG